MKRFLACSLCLLTIVSWLSIPATAAGKPYDGTTLYVLLCDHAWTEQLYAHLDEFTEATGIAVVTEEYPEDRLSQKLALRLAGKQTDLDVFMTRPLQEVRWMIDNGWLYDISDLMQSPSMAAEDFMDSTLTLYQSGGACYGVPLVTERQILYYRKDLLDKAGIAVPTTLDELRVAAQALTDMDEGIYGFLSRGLPAAAVTQFSSFLYSMGGDWMDAEGNAAIATKEAIWALTYYGDMLREFAPPDAKQMHWQQCASLFASGKVALYTDADAIFNSVVNAEGSVVSDKTGYALFPGESFYNISSWGMSVSAYTQNAGAACEFVKWVASKEMTKAIQAAGVPGARASVYRLPEANTAFPDQLVRVIEAASTKETKAYDRPMLTSVAQARDYIGQAISVAISGGDVMTAAREANEGFQLVIETDRAAGKFY